MFKGLIILFAIMAFVFVPFCRFLPFKIPMILHYAPRDLYEYFKYKKWNECKFYGFIDIYNGYFGSGKSLSAVERVINQYRQYNGKMIWCKELNSFIPQKITIISNLELVGVPFIPFEDEKQLINYEAELGEVLIFLIDEIGTVWNNRDFKDFNPDVFANIVQSRKRKMAIVGTLPKIVGTDINVRRFTDDVIVCTKTWRIIKHRYFKADELENCSNVDMLEPHTIRYMFVTNRMYEQYNTNAMIDKLKRDMELGKLMSFKELANQSDGNGDIKQAKLRRKYKKRQV